MDKRVVLCVDELSLREPAMIGLPGEPLGFLPWLECATDARQCREAAARLSSVEEVWVISCDDMGLINVAAAVKHDDPGKRVFMACRDESGSTASRAMNAGLDGLWSQAQFLRRFSQVKSAFAEVERRTKDGGAGLPEAVAPSGSSSSRSGDAPRESRCIEDSGKELDASTRLTAPVSSQTASSSKAATVIAVVSGSGGCGKSTVSAVFAGLASKAGLSTIVIDADLQFGDMDRMLGKKDPLRVEDALSSPSRLACLADEARKGIALVAAPRRVELSEEVARGLPLVFDQLSSACDVLIVNTGAFWSDVQACALEAADAVAFLMDSRPSSLYATVRAVELCARMGLATASFSFAVNRHEKSSMLSAVDASCSLRGAHAVEVSDGGRDVDELLGSGYVFELLNTRNALVRDVEQLLGRLLPAEKRDVLLRSSPKPSRKRKSLFRREG